MEFLMLSTLIKIDSIILYDRVDITGRVGIQPEQKLSKWLDTLPFREYNP